jgi:hypothetical protein
MSTPLSSRREPKSTPWGCLVLFFLVFLFAGLAASWSLLVRPVSGLLAAQGWAEASCTVLESRVEESSDSDGSTYRVFVRYAYEADGRGYESTRYDFFDVSSSGYEGKAQVVARHPPGARVPCWVDPADPREAVLDRGFGWRYAVGLFPLIFVFVGLGGMVWAFKQRSGARRRAGALSGGPPGGGGRSPFGVELPADLVSGRELTTLHPFLKFLGIVLVTLFWNGITSVFVWKVVEGWRAGSPDGCLTLFIIPFALIGLLMIAGMGSQFLVLFNPRPRLTLTPGTIAPGETAYLHWRISGRARRIRRLRLELQGAERASYRQGTDTKTVEEVFATILLFEADQPFAIAEGSASFSVPAGTMPSFEAPHNQIAWTVKAHLDIPGWPDTQETYDVIVRPGRR